MKSAVEVNPAPYQLQRPEFVDPDSGLLRNSSEHGERDARYGVRGVGAWRQTVKIALPLTIPADALREVLMALELGPRANSSRSVLELSIVWPKSKSFTDGLLPVLALRKSTR